MQTEQRQCGAARKQRCGAPGKGAVQQQRAALAESSRWAHRRVTTKPYVGARRKTLYMYLFLVEQNHFVLLAIYCEQ
jgi:hypothetical protein